MSSVVLKHNPNFEAIQNESAILYSLNHPNIISPIEDRERLERVASRLGLNSKCCLMLEKGEFDLYDLIKLMFERKDWDIFLVRLVLKDVCKGL